MRQFKERPTTSKKSTPRIKFFGKMSVRLKACLTKKTFHSLRSAARATEEIYDKTRGKTVMIFYQCPFCEGFHLTKRR